MEEWRIARLESKATQIESEVAALRSDVRRLDSKIDALNAKIDSLKDSSATWKLVLDEAWWLVMGLVFIGTLAWALRLI